MGEKISSIIDSIIENLKDGPKSIKKLSELTKINWRTAESYLEILKNLDIVGELSTKTPRLFYYKDKDTYYKLYVKPNDSELITTIYYTIRKICTENLKKEPTKTQVYKILWNINEKLRLKLPVGWYMFGPCCIQIYTGEETKKMNLEKTIETELKKVTIEYCSLGNIELQRKVYTESDNKLYRTKEKLLDAAEKKEELNVILMDFIKYSPPETRDLVVEFSKKIISTGWDKTIFDYLWKYISIIELKKSLEPYYGKNIDTYLYETVNELRKDAELLIFN